MERVHEDNSFSKFGYEVWKERTESEGNEKLSKVSI